MKVALIVSRKDATGVKRAKEITQILKDLGHQVDDSMLKRTLKEENQAIEDTFKKHMRSIKNADVILVESTQYSAGLGFLVATALNERKQVLCLQYNDPKYKGSVTLRGANSKLLTYLKYSEEDLKKIITNYLDEAKDKLDTKFILIISPEIDKYLKWAAEERRMHKAQIVRDAVESQIAKDKEYKEYLRSAN